MDIKENMLIGEKHYKKYASFNKDAVRFKDDDVDFRGEYFRDIDRIIYSLSYTRYIDKTQVFSFNENDHLSKRIIHVQLVSKIARTIGRALSLNEDLIEAASLGHDIGHVPFGHRGEAILNKICQEQELGYFNHNVQSVRQLMFVEKNGNGSNLTLQTLDAIMCHNGEIEKEEYRPVNKTKEKFLEEYNNCYIDKFQNTSLIPMTLEGCVVRISDIIAYIGRDIEDAISLNLISTADIPKDITKVLGNTNSSIINTLINDIISNSYNKPYIKLSKEVFNALSSLKKFNYSRIYSYAMTDEQARKYEVMFRFLFKKYLEELEKENKNSIIYKVFLSKMNNTYKKETSNKRIVIDYIAGMTDDYIIREYNSYGKSIND